MDLVTFLVRAKRGTYASAGEGEEQKGEDGSRTLVYEEDGFKYRDTYFGFSPFSGEEVVWQDGKPIWVMNYHGQLLSDDVPASEVYDFLKAALKEVDEDWPFRGLALFEHADYEDFEYANGGGGSVDFFIGNEYIRYRGNMVYKLTYHGGVVD